MSSTDKPYKAILLELQERAKELNCLYCIDEVLQSDMSELDELLLGIVKLIPGGWQYPSVCAARITLEDRIYPADAPSPTEWSMSSALELEGRRVGSVDVFYTEERADADEGPFLKEERKLIDSIADRICHHLTIRRLKQTFESTQSAGRISGEMPPWWTVVDFLRHTDANLLVWIGRKLLNYLAWQGVEEAKAMLAEWTSSTEGARSPDENRPLAKRPFNPPSAFGDRVFELAAAHLADEDVLGQIHNWICDEKSSYLVTSLESAESTLTDIANALDRYRHTGLDENDLSVSIRKGLRVGLLRKLFSDDLNFINTAKSFVELKDFFGLRQQLVLWPRSRGKLGGKSAGLFLARRILEARVEDESLLADVRVPKTMYLPSDGLSEFIRYNHLEDVYNWKYMDADEVRQQYPNIVQVFKNSQLPPEIMAALSQAIDELEGRPIIARSSSLLEDRMGSAFSGKYKSLFLSNQGDKKERLAELADAIAEIYASIFSPDPIEYRAERGLLDEHEEMGILLQEVVGTRVGRYFLPVLGGVGFSNNEYRWSPRIKRDDGLVRIVPGLGTRAVDRTADDYPVLVAPGQPGLRANVTTDEIVRYSPKQLDVIDLEAKSFTTVSLRQLLSEHPEDFPSAAQVLSVFEGDHLRPMGRYELDLDPGKLTVTFEGLISNTPFVARLRAIMNTLRDAFGMPVDIEFAYDGEHLYLLQCRPQSYSAESAPASIPRDVPDTQILFSANRHVSNGTVEDITHVVYVDPEGYQNLQELEELRQVGRAVGRLNKILPKRQFILMGPGRWGSRGDIKLGVNVTYADINNTAVLIEMARLQGSYVPDLSFGTHFFQDLVEADIRYIPLYPDDDGVLFNERFLRSAPNLLPDLLPEFSDLQYVIRVIDIPMSREGKLLHVLMNAELDEALGIFGEARSKTGSLTDLSESLVTVQNDEHWRWRSRMAHELARQLDGKDFGVKAMYLIGSTKNGTAGAGSDIDLVIHFVGSERQRRELEFWLAGWSQSLAEMNRIRTGYSVSGLLDVHFVDDDEVVAKTGFANKIEAVTDAARRLSLKGEQDTPS